MKRRDHNERVGSGQEQLSAVGRVDTSAAIRMVSSGDEESKALALGPADSVVLA